MVVRAGDSSMIIITGPTGVGKTDLSLAIAAAVNGEILNADVGQFYTPLTLGTAKPDWRVQEVPHHLFDMINQPENLNIAEFRRKAHATMQAIAKRGHVPLVVGGSGFYVQGLLYAPCSDTQVPARIYQETTEQLWNELATIDPQRAAHMSKTDRYRITRALDIWHGLGVLPSQCVPTFQPLAHKVLVLVLTRPIQELHARINERVEAMMRAGWLDEVRALDERWQEFLIKKKLIGYNDIIRHLRGEIQYTQLVKTIQQKTRQYAKRQMTFMRMLERKFQQHSVVSMRWLSVNDNDNAAIGVQVKEWYESR